MDQSYLDITSIDGRRYFGQKPAAPKSELNTTTFLRLLSAQLSNQNPLEPMKDRDFFAQIAQLGTVEGVDKIKATLQLSQASGLLGKTVKAFMPLTDAASGGRNQDVTGVVKGIQLKDGEYWLKLKPERGNEVDVKLTNVKEVKS